MESNADDCRLSDDDFDYSYDELYYDLCNDGVDAALDDCNLSSNNFQDLTNPLVDTMNLSGKLTKKLLKEISVKGRDGRVSITLNDNGMKRAVDWMERATDGME